MLIVLACIASGSICLGLIWLFAPGRFENLSTRELVLMLSLMVLPGLTLWALIAERNERERRRVLDRERRVHEAGRTLDDSAEHRHAERVPSVRVRV